MRVETRRIAGEDLEVWRWIQVSREGRGEKEREGWWVGGDKDAGEAGNTWWQSDWF